MQIVLIVKVIVKCWFLSSRFFGVLPGFNFSKIYHLYDEYYFFNWLVLYNRGYWYCCYVDDNTPYLSADNINGVIKSLEEASEILFKWFSDNLMKINADKCHLLVSTNNTVKIKIGNFDITNSKSEKLLGVKFDH